MDLLKSLRLLPLLNKIVDQAEILGNIDDHRVYTTEELQIIYDYICQTAHHERFPTMDQHIFIEQ